MPIRPEERARYPKDWPAISRRIREREGQRCKWCLAPNGALIYRAVGVYILEDGDTRDEETGAHITWTRGSELPDGRFVRVVLTVAHLDHTPENCADENLAALCQKCHLTYDAKHHAANARRTRERKSGQGRLFP